MNTAEILDSLNREIGNLQQARKILTGKKPPQRETKARVMSPQGRKNIAAAQRKRWAKLKAA